MKTLGDVCEIKLGKTPSRNNKSYWDEEKTGSNKWVSIADLTKLKTRFISDTKEYISDAGAKQFKPVKRGTLLMSFKLSIGKLAYADCDLYTNEAIVALPIKNNDILNIEFLYYYLQFYDWDKETENDIKLKGKTLNKAKLKNIRIPIPPLELQKKIVKKLDAIFAEVDKAFIATETNAKNAEALFQSYLTEVFERGGEGWITTVLDNVCKVDRGSSPRPIKNFLTSDEDGVNWIKIGDTEEGGKYIFSTNQKITKEGAEKSRYVGVGDFILTNSMSYGRPYIMRINGYIHDGWFVLRLNENIDTEYFYYLLTSPYVQNQFKSLAAGSVVKNISGDLVKKTVLPIPKIDEQKRLAEIFTDKQIVLKRLSEVYLEKSKQLISFKKSILQKAFSGELVKE
jgi:restriction endonuclease S subunit